MFGLSSLLGSVASGVMGLFGANQTNQMNMQMVQQQEQFQEQMSNTAYQRASKDMQAAGLNPMMMFGSGSAASTPSGATAPMTSGLTSAGQAVGSATKSALDAMVMDKTIDKMTDEISNLKATNAKIQAETATEQEKPPLLRQNAAKALWETVNEKLASYPAALKADLSKKGQDVFSTDFGDTLYKAGLLGRTTSDVISPATDLVNSAVGARRTFHNIWRDRVDRGFAN